MCGSQSAIIHKSRQVGMHAQKGVLDRERGLNHINGYGGSFGRRVCSGECNSMDFYIKIHEI